LHECKQPISKTGWRRSFHRHSARDAGAAIAARQSPARTAEASSAGAPLI
jgi:hypothetical protein